MPDEPIAVERGVALRGIQGRSVRQYASLDRILEAVASGKSPAGYVTSIRGPWLAHRRWPKKLQFMEVSGSPDRFPICAAVRKSDGELKRAIDEAWDALAKSDKLAEVFARWHIPYASPKTAGVKPSK